MSEDKFLKHDADGKCLRHPQIQLRRLSAAGRWRTLLSSCPLCSISPLERERCRPSLSSICDEDHISRFMSSSMSFSTETDTTLDLSSCASSASSLSHGDCPQVTVSSPTSLRRQSLTSPSGLSPISSPKPLQPFLPLRKSSKKSVVCGMFYVCPDTNRPGSYTGQLHPETQSPHGIGPWRYRDGSLSEGEWCDGRLSVEPLHYCQHKREDDATEPFPLHLYLREDFGDREANSFDEEDSNSLRSNSERSTASNNTSRISYSAREFKGTNSSRHSSDASRRTISHHDSFSANCGRQRNYMEIKHTVYTRFHKQENLLKLQE